jgi:hypothetical protein
MGLSCSVAWNAVVRWTDSAASFFESRLRVVAFFRVAALDCFEEDDFGTVRPLVVGDLVVDRFFDGFFTA